MSHRLKVKRGTLSETKADVLVNVIAGNSRNLAQCGTVANSILAAGGQKLQQFYDAEPPPVEFGRDVAITRSSGILQAKFIYHAFVKNYKDQQSEKLLYNTICKCLNLAVNAEQTSIAFPTVGCGKLGYDPTIVAKCFERAIRDTRCALKIYVVAFDEDTFNSFNYVLNAKLCAPPLYDEEDESAAARVGLWSEPPPRYVAEPDRSSTWSQSQPQRVKSKVVEKIPDELDEYVRELFPKMLGDELYKLTDHLRSLGIDEPAEMKTLKESDLAGFVKPVRIRNLLDAVSAQQTQRSEISFSRHETTEECDPEVTVDDSRRFKGHLRDAVEFDNSRQVSKRFQAAEKQVSDELDVYLEETFPKMSDAERRKIKDHLQSAGIEEPEDMIHVREKDLEGSIRPIHIRKLLERIVTQKTKRTENESNPAGAPDESQSQSNATLTARAGLSRTGLDAVCNVIGQKRELNILLLGETGVGKSTWINGLINYLSYDTLAEAERSDMLCLIPTSFTMTDENFKQREIKWGEIDSNEKHNAGQSATQGAKTYTFKMPDIVLRIIDTPGIGDTRGIEQDKKNMENIMSHLSHFKELHGICILLKPNNARLTVMFEFCVKELLTNLHKDACGNMVVCFTNARGTFYRPGDTMPALQTLLASSKTVPIDLSKEIIYCMDNEAVRFLAAVKNGVKFDAMENSNFEASWKKSVDETLRLITHIAGLQPHKVDRTLSLNNARRSILKLSRPIGEISRLIQINIDVVKDKANEILSADMSKKELEQRLHVPAIDLEAVPLKQPCTVCTASSCTKQVTFGAVTKTEYIKRCHPGCQLSGFETDRINTPALQQCWAMSPGGVKCRVCNCSWNVHMHVNYETRQVKKDVIDESVKLLISDKESKIKAIKEHKATLETKVKELEDEKVQIAKVSAQFACFLKANAIAPYNDAVKAYLEHLIEVEKDKVSARGDRKTLEGLEKMRNVYVAEIDALEKAMDDKTSQQYADLNPKDIQQKIELLYNLPFAGPQLKQMMSVVDNCAASAVANSERAVEVKTKSMRDHLRKGGQWLYNKVVG